MTKDEDPAGDGAAGLLLLRARSTDGFFELDEASFLMQSVRALTDRATVLEVGSYKGRSTLFLLAAMAPEQRLFSVDSFRTAASYSGHSYADLLSHVDDPRHHVLPMPLRKAHKHLRPMVFDLVLIDADHSFSGASQDLALCVDLSREGAVVLCHDVCDIFPGVLAATGALVSAGVMRESGRAATLVAYQVMCRPSWLVDPGVFRDG